MAAAATLAGCAGTRVIDNDVQTFSSLESVAAPATFRFDRLPSQQAQAAQHARLETIAAQALARVGLQPETAQPRYLVQIGARTDRDSPAWDPLYGPGWPERTRYFVDGGPVIWSPYMRFPPPPSLFRREVSLVMRDAASGRVVYETRALHEGTWTDEPATLAAMFDAALRDFPNPLPGVRRVNIALPR